MDVGSLEEGVAVGVQNWSEVLVFLDSQQTNDEDQSLKHITTKLISLLLHDGKQGVEGVCQELRGEEEEEEDLVEMRGGRRRGGANLDNLISRDSCDVLHSFGEVFDRHLPPVQETVEVSCRGGGVSGLCHSV